MPRHASMRFHHSTLMTSAPQSPRTMVRVGPARRCVRSSTRTPESGRPSLALVMGHAYLDRTGVAGRIELFATEPGLFEQYEVVRLAKGWCCRGPRVGRRG